MLDKLSGDMELLDTYLESRNENILWHEKDDLILSKIKDSSSPELRLFNRMKGEKNVKKRIVYLGLNFKFL